jgi:hypothetical protein
MTRLKTAAAILFTTLATSAMAQVPLGTVDIYGVLGASAVTNTGPTVVNGALGISPGASISGFPPGIASGPVNVANAAALQAQTDATTAYNFLASQACGTTLTGTDLGGLTLTPGVYCFASSAQLTGTLTLNAQGNAGALFIFQVGSALTTASGSSVVFVNGAQACNVYWQMGSSATLGTTTTFAGTLISLASNTLNTGATLAGRVIARTGAVTLDSNNITVPACGGSAGGGSAIPTLGEWTLLLLAMLTAFTAMFVMRRSRR